MTSVRYFIPEDGDKESHPNVFLAPKPKQPGYPPTLGEIKKTFPLPGRYHFRFKAPLVPGTDRDKGTLAVWMDCVDDRQPVPTWKSGIVAKITRIGVEDDFDDDDDDDFVRTPAPAAAAAPPRPTPPPAGPTLDIFDGPSPTSSASQPQHAPAPASHGSLLDGHHPTPVAATASKDSLLDMSSPPYGASNSGGSGGHSDFLGMHATPSPPVSGGYPMHQAPGQTQQQPFGGAPQRSSSQNNAFDSFSNQQGPFGGLGTPWK